MRISTDLVVIGAAFGGSLTALIANRMGLRTVLVERGSHPRFAIGESSTPAADLALRELCQRYDLPRIMPLTQYGSWRRTYPTVMRGLKRGFSYFHHHPGTPFAPTPNHENELLVEANPDDEHSDTQWLRADVDHFFVCEAEAAGVPYVDRTAIEAIDASDPWRLVGRRDGRVIEIEAPFLVDASGGGGFLCTMLGVRPDTDRLSTHSRSIYSHFTGVKRWRHVLEAAGGRTEDHPFDCDSAALHHVFDGGWMWVLRFDDDVVSAGFTLDCSQHPLDTSRPVNDEWEHWLSRFPSIAAQFADAEPVRPLCRTGRLQRLASMVAGTNWAMLPSTGGFIDPLHSTGIAHTISGVERLAEVLQSESERAQDLESYNEAVRNEFKLIDHLVHGCYRAFHRPDLMAAFSMCYFAGAIATEHRRRDGQHHVGDGFLMVHDETFRNTVAHAHERVCALSDQDDLAAEAVTQFNREIAGEIAGYNHAGLCDPTKRNMYEWG